jgi:hypothetical protein
MLSTRGRKGFQNACLKYSMSGAFKERAYFDTLKDKIQRALLGALRIPQTAAHPPRWFWLFLSFFLSISPVLRLFKATPDTHHPCGDAA